MNAVTYDNNFLWLEHLHNLVSQHHVATQWLRKVVGKSLTACNSID